MRVQLSACHKRGPAAQIIRAVGLCGQRFRSIMGRNAQNFIRPQQGAGAARGHIALAHMHTIGPCGQRYFYVVIHHKGHIPRMAQRGQCAGFFQQGGRGKLFLPQLHKCCAAIQRGGYRIQQGAPLQAAAIRYSVQTHLLR